MDSMGYVSVTCHVLHKFTRFLSVFFFLQCLVNVCFILQYEPLDPKTMKKCRCSTHKIWVITPKHEGYGFPRSTQRSCLGIRQIPKMCHVLPISRWRMSTSIILQYEIMYFDFPGHFVMQNMATLRSPAKS